MVTFESFLFPIYVPLLFRLAALRSLNPSVSLGDGTIFNNASDWQVKLVLKLEHPYVRWPPAIYYTDNELECIHPHFYHLHTVRLMNLVSRGANAHATPDLCENLEKLRSIVKLVKNLQRIREDFGLHYHMTIVYSTTSLERRS